MASQLYKDLLEAFGDIAELENNANLMNEVNRQKALMEEALTEADKYDLDDDDQSFYDYMSDQFGDDDRWEENPDVEGYYRQEYNKHLNDDTDTDDGIPSWPDWLAERGYNNVELTWPENEELWKKLRDEYDKEFNIEDNFILQQDIQEESLDEEVNWNYAVKADYFDRDFKKNLPLGTRLKDKETGEEYFVAKYLPKSNFGRYKNRCYILPISYIDNVKAGLRDEGGYQIDALWYLSDYEKIEESLDEETKLDTIRANKRAYEILQKEISSMPEGLEKDVAKLLGLRFIKGDNWMGGLGNGKAVNDLFYKIAYKNDVDISDVMTEFENAFIHNDTYGLYESKQITEETNSEKLAKHYNVKMPVKEAKYTKDELVDKFGTDDLDLINAGNEEDVELEDDIDKLVADASKAIEVEGLHADVSHDGSGRILVKINCDARDHKYLDNIMVGGFGCDKVDETEPEEDAEVYTSTHIYSLPAHYDYDIDLENPDLEEGFWEFDQEDDEPTATCPDCGEEMVYVGAQGYDEEFKCPVCGEYHYLKKGKLV